MAEKKTSAVTALSTQIRKDHPGMVAPFTLHFYLEDPAPATVPAYLTIVKESLEDIITILLSKTGNPDLSFLTHARILDHSHSSVHSYARKGSSA